MDSARRTISPAVPVLFWFRQEIPRSPGFSLGSSSSSVPSTEILAQADGIFAHAKATS